MAPLLDVLTSTHNDNGSRLYHDSLKTYVHFAFLSGPLKRNQESTVSHVDGKH